MGKKVGIIIPIYNVSQFLSECIESAINQSYKNLSIILINDGSTDDSLNIAMKYFLQDDRITIINKPNGGQASARNAGLDYLLNSIKIESIKYDTYYIIKGRYIYKGCFKDSKQEYESQILNTSISIEIFSHKENVQECDYIHFLDSDDLLCCDCINMCMQFVYKQNNIDIVWHSFFNITERQEKPLSNCNEAMNIESKLNYTELSNIQALEKKLQITEGFVWHGLISLNIINCYRLRFMDFMYAEDQLFAFMLFACANKVLFIQYKLYAYRVRSNSIMTFNPHIHKYPQSKSDIFLAFKDKELASMYDKSYSLLCMAYAMTGFIETNLFNKEIKEYLNKAVIYLTPSSVKAIYAVSIENKDPKKVRELFMKIKTYIPSNHFKIATKIAFYCPKIYKIFFHVKKRLKN